jgi:hypothetical protein
VVVGGVSVESVAAIPAFPATTVSTTTPTVIPTTIRTLRYATGTAGVLKPSVTVLIQVIQENTAIVPQTLVGVVKQLIKQLMDSKRKLI